MKKLYLPAVIILSVLINGCSAEDLKPNFENNINDSNSKLLLADSHLSEKRVTIDDHFTDFGEICEFNNLIYVSAEYRFSYSDFVPAFYNVNDENMIEPVSSHDCIEDAAVSDSSCYYTLESDEESFYICRYDKEALEPELEIPVPDSGKIRYSDGIVYCFNDDSCNVYDEDLNLLNTFCFSDYSDYISRTFDVVLDSDRNLYRISYNKEDQEYTLIRLNADDGKAAYITSDFGDLSSSCDGSLTGFFVNKNMIYLASASSENDNIQYINVIDKDKGKTLNRFELENSQFIGEGTEDYDICYKFDDSLYGYNISDDNSEVLYSNPDIVKSVNSGSDWNCFGDNLWISHESSAYNGDSNVVLIFDEDMNLLDFQQGAIMNKPFYASDDCIYFLQNDGNEDIKITVSDDGINRTDYAEINTDGFVTEFWVYDDKIWLIISDFENNANKLKCYNTDGRCIAEQDFPYSLVRYKSVDGKNTAVLMGDNKLFLGVISENEISEQNNIRGINLSDGIFEYSTENEAVFLSYNISDNYIEETDIVTGDGNSRLNLSDFGINNVIGITKISDTEYIISGVNYSGERVLWKIYKSDNQCNKLIISGVNISDFYMNIIHDYDELNDDVEIITNNYTADSDAVISDLDKELIIEKSPDIIIGDSSLSIYEYSKKYQLYDMSEFINSTINKQDYFDCTFTCLDSKIIQVVPFLESTGVFMIPKENDIFDDWDYFDYFAYIKDNKDSIYSYTPEIWTSILLNTYLYEHVDFLNEKCDFNNQSFCNLIEFIKDYSVSESDFNSDENILTDEPAFDFTSIMQYASYCASDISHSIKGIPGEEKSYVLFSDVYGVFMPAESGNPDAAKKFISYLLDSEIQKRAENEMNALPTCRNIMLSELKELTKTEDGTYAGLSDIKDMLNSKDMIADISHSKLFSIVADEIYEYCENGGSSAETANRIQNKVTLYLSEL